MRRRQLFEIEERDLRRMIREAEETEEKKPAKLSGNDSLDKQIDRLFIDYESEAKSTVTEAKDWRMTVRRLVEDAEKDDTNGDEIDVESFANSVVRLIDNYDSLLEVRNAILRRAGNFLAKGYGKDIVKEFMNTLRDDHGMVIGKSPEDVADEEFPAPIAGRAGAGETGGGGA